MLLISWTRASTAWSINVFNLGVFTESPHTVPHHLEAEVPFKIVHASFDGFRKVVRHTNPLTLVQLFASVYPHGKVVFPDFEEFHGL